MNCKKSEYSIEEIEYVKAVASIIQKEQGYYPLINTKNRIPKLVEARQILSVMLSRYTLWSQTKIGKITGAKDHSTMSHSKKRVNEHYETEKDYRSIFDHIETRVKLLPK